MTKRGRRVVALLALCVVVAVGAAVFFLVDFGGDDGKPAARKRNALVTEADNGGDVSVKTGQTFVVDVQGSVDAPWGLPQAGTEALARISTSEELDGSATATFRALEATPGAQVTAQRVAPCEPAGTPCEQRIERFEVTIRVVG